MDSVASLGFAFGIKIAPQFAALTKSVSSRQEGRARETLHVSFFIESASLDVINVPALSYKEARDAHVHSFPKKTVRSIMAKTRPLCPDEARVPFCLHCLLPHLFRKTECAFTTSVIKKENQYV